MFYICGFKQKKFKPSMVFFIVKLKYPTWKRLFTIDLAVVEHKVFMNELLALCEGDDSKLQQHSCYKNVTNLVPLRQSALRALAACHYMPECREKIFSILYKSLQVSIVNFN